MNVNVIARHSESPQRPDVRHRKRIAERSLHQPRDDRDLRQGERYHWQDLVLPRAIVPAADRQGMESQTKSQLQERRDDEDGQNDSKYRRAIDGARANCALAHRSSQAERRARKNRDEHGLCAERSRDGQRLGKEFVDGKIPPMQARPEIAMGETLQIEPELPHERQVEPVDPAQVLGDFRIERPLGIKRSAGRETHQEKCKGDDDEKRRNRRRDTSKKKPKHDLSGNSDFEPTPSAPQRPESADRTKMFHVKHFGKFGAKTLQGLRQRRL